MTSLAILSRYYLLFLAVLAVAIPLYFLIPAAVWDFLALTESEDE